VFVANPNKAKAILDILLKNKEKLVTFLSTFHNDRQGIYAQPKHGKLAESITIKQRMSSSTTKSLSCSSKFKTCKQNLSLSLHSELLFSPPSPLSLSLFCCRLHHLFRN